MHAAIAQGADITVPRVVQAGMQFSVQCAGSGKAMLYILGPAQVLKRDIQLGVTTTFPSGTITNAGHYIVLVFMGSSTREATFDVVPSNEIATVSFFASPSRLPVDLQNAITGSVYVFDAYHNLIVLPASVSFELTSPNGQTQTHVVVTDDGAAWTKMSSTSAQGTDRFLAKVGNIYTTRIVGQVPGDPCSLKMTAQLSGQHIQLVTQPVVDCKGNAVPDGTIVTFTESDKGTVSTVDVPLKRGIAEVLMPIQRGATISVASGVVLGNQIGWGK